jgi:hypothetical protein
MIPTSGFARLTLDLLGWRMNHPSSYDALDTRFLSAVTGGFLLGWGVMTWCLSSWVYPTAPDPVRRSVVASLLAWFCLDSAGSNVSGNPSTPGSMSCFTALENGLTCTQQISPMKWAAVDV